MEKVLSIIIPTYNMAQLLPRCVGSLEESGALGRIEAVIVNDGSKDNSLEIAREWEARYPDSITVIDKPNGNYGSTINAALPRARGKYVKILDSDDWFAPAALASFVDELAEADADMAVTHFTMIHPGGKKELAKYNLYGREPYEYGKVYDLDKVLGDGYIRFFLMHALTYRTQMLLEAGYRQTEGCSYTDLEWDVYPILPARSIVFFDLDLYQYNLDREGQTMDPKVVARSLGQLGRVTDNILTFYENAPKDCLSPQKKAFLDQFFRNRVRLMAKSYLMDIPRGEFSAETFAPVDRSLREHMGRLGLEQIRLFPANKIIRVDAYAYWRRHGTRLPAWLEAVNRVADKIMTFLYTLLFR